MSRLIETIRLENGKFNNLNYHQQRLDRTLNSLYTNYEKWNIEKIVNETFHPRQGLFKCRLIYDDNDFKVEFEPYIIRPVQSLRIIEENISYSFKFTDRSVLNKAFQKREDCDDVLIIKSGNVTDTSYANIALKKHDRWITPSTYLLNGTQRQFLLEERKIEEEQIQVKDMASFSKFKLINAMLLWESPEADVSNII